MITYDADGFTASFTVAKLLLGNGPQGKGFSRLGVSPNTLKRVLEAPHTLKLATLYAQLSRLRIQPLICPWPNGATVQEADELAESMLELYTQYVVDGAMVNETQPDVMFAVLLVRPNRDIDFYEPGRMPVRMPDGIPADANLRPGAPSWPEGHPYCAAIEHIHGMVHHGRREYPDEYEATIDAIHAAADEMSPEHVTLPTAQSRVGRPKGSRNKPPRQAAHRLDPPTSPATSSSGAPSESSGTAEHGGQEPVPTKRVGRPPAHPQEKPDLIEFPKKDTGPYAL